MKPPPLPLADVLPVAEPVDADVRPVDAVPAFPVRPMPAGGLWSWVKVFPAWCQRILVGAFLCMFWWSGVAVMGWTYRWMQALVLRGWWRKSRLAGEGSFEEFCDSLGLEAPVSRPRWFLQERLRSHLKQPASRGAQASALQTMGRAFMVPWHSLWLNVKIGAQALFCTYLLTGWGCLLMEFSWEFGWLNSFNKGYEQAAIGPLVGLMGIGLFILAMVYVPMAQVHQAVVGSPWAFFEFRFVLRLIHARMSAYVVLAGLMAAVALPLEILKSAPSGFGQLDLYADAGDADTLKYLHNYFFACCLVFFPLLLLVRLFAALIYRSAVLKCLRRGWVQRSDLNPILAAWFDRLDLYPSEARTSGAIVKAARAGGRLASRGVLYFLMVLLWYVFVAEVYVGEFVDRHPHSGFLNRPLVQDPFFNYTPPELGNSPSR